MRRIALNLVGRPHISGNHSSSIGLGWMVLGLFVTLFSLTVLPWLATSVPTQVDNLTADPVMLVTFGFGLLAEFTGTILLATSFIRGQSGSRWIGYVLLASAFMLMLGDLIAPGGPATNVALNLVSNLGPILLLVALGALGYQLWSMGSQAAKERSESTNGNRLPRYAFGWGVGLWLIG